MTTPGQVAYPFFDNQGPVFSSKAEPTETDNDFAEAGMLVTVRLRDLHCFGVDRKWQAASAAHLVNPEVDGLLVGPFHSITTAAQTFKEPDGQSVRPPRAAGKVRRRQITANDGTVT